MTAQINCEVCGKNFKANLRDEPEGGGILRLFTCPHCSTDYPVAFIQNGKVEDRRRHAN